MDMKMEALTFFASTTGQKLLGEFRNVHPKDLPTLVLKLAKQGVPFPSELATLLKLRHKSIGKFSQAASMFFTSEGLEQASGENISQYIANRFKETIKEGVVTDLTCGIGGNTIFLAEYFKVRAIDIDESHLYCAKHNAGVYGNRANIDFITGRAEDNIKASQAYIIDPQRIRSHQTKTRSIENSNPKLKEILPKIFAATSNICVKISPAFDYEEILNLPGDPEIELISEGNINKGAILWFGKLKTAQRRATILDSGNPVSYTDNLSLDNLSSSEELKKYLFIPNKAIIKAHLVDQVAALYNLSKISAKNEYLSSDILTVYPEKVFRVFEIIEYRSFSIKNAKNLVKEQALDRAHIVAKHFIINPEDLRRRLKLKEGGNYSLIFIGINDQNFIVLAKNIY